MEIYLGTWQTSPSDGFWTDQDRSLSESVLSSAVRLGLTGFDTAQSYGKGQAEQLLSKVLRRFPDRPFAVDTKIMPSSKPVPDIVQRSLKALGPVGIDCLYLHWPRTGFDHVDFLRQMQKLREDGIVKRIGVCNMSLGQVKVLLDNGIRIDRFQRPLSLLWSRDWDTDAAFCTSAGIETVGYSPMGMGLLSGRYRSSSDLADARASLFCFDPLCLDDFRFLLSELSSVAESHNCKPSDIALAWTASKDPDIMLLGARDKDQLAQNIKALSLKLSDEDMERLDQAALRLETSGRKVCMNIFSYKW